MRIVRLVNPPESANLKSSKVTLSPGEEVGEHLTENREEMILVIRGKGVLTKGTESARMEEGSMHHVGNGVKHNVRNDSDGEMEYIYVVVPAWLISLEYFINSAAIYFS